MRDAVRSFVPPYLQIALAILLLPLLFVLLRAALQLSPEPPSLAHAVTEKMEASGVRHPLTAVLLNFRGYDTLLEVTVLWIAGIGALALTSAPTTRRGTPHSVLIALMRVLAPALVMTAGYILWAGAFRPGGAFQSGAVLGAGLVLSSLAGLLPLRPGLWVRAGLVAGPAVFALVALIAWLITGEMLHYPADTDGLAILAIESVAAPSIAMVLWLLFDRLHAPAENESDQQSALHAGKGGRSVEMSGGDA